MLSVLYFERLLERKSTILFRKEKRYFKLLFSYYYKVNFALVQHHKYSLTEIENMIPWEREVYVTLLKQYIEEENLKKEQSG